MKMDMILSEFYQAFKEIDGAYILDYGVVKCVLKQMCSRWDWSIEGNGVVGIHGKYETMGSEPTKEDALAKLFMATQFALWAAIKHTNIDLNDRIDERN